jgi:hypothetical protein
MHGDCPGNFLNYPFLLDLQFKQQLIDNESRLEMMRSISKSLRPMHIGELHKSMFFLLLEVSRDTMLEESLEKFSSGIDLKKPLKVVFRG